MSFFNLQNYANLVVDLKLCGLQELIAIHPTTARISGFHLFVNI